MNPTKKEITAAIAAQTPIHVDQSTAIIQVIERAASNPDVDIDKMERLLQMQERIMGHKAKAAYTDALAQAQLELPEITKHGEIKNKAGGVQSKYALWEDINEAIKPVLARHGFSLSFRFPKPEPGSVAVTGVLSHREGHAEETTITLPVDTSGSKNPVQAVASSTSYGKRYTAGALLNLTARGEDDDGFAAGVQLITEEQRDELIALADEVKADKAGFCGWLKVPSIADIPASKFAQAKAGLEAKRRKP